MKRVFAFTLIIVLFISSCSNYENADKSKQNISIFPDYTDISIPCNITAMNFSVLEKGELYKADFSIEGTSQIKVTSRKGKIRIPQKKWKRLISDNKGKTLEIEIFVKNEGTWTAYPAIQNIISEFPIDQYMSYRLIYPHTGDWKDMGLYQRDLSSFKETVILENKSIDNSCLNCHHVSAHDANNFMFHVRAGKANGTYIIQGDEIRKIAPKIYDLYPSVGYAWWHPNGKYIVFSVNSVNGRDVNQSSVHLINGADSKSDLVVYSLENNEFYTDKGVFNSDYWETYPYWADDGKTIYYCRADAIDAMDHEDLTKIQYDLMKVEFDITTHTWSSPEMVIDASSMNRSVAFPRISPDGRYLMYTLYDFGIFSIWRSISDIAILDLKENRSYFPNKINTKKTESYHSWSSNGRWFIYSSKFPDDECGRPYIASFDPKTGQTTKGFILPQKDPEFYRRFYLSYNLPELYHTPSKLSDLKLLKATEEDGVPAKVNGGPGSKGYYKKEESSPSIWKIG